MLIDKNVIKMYEKKITHMPTPKYRHLAFQIDEFYKENGYINTADLISHLSGDKEALSTIGEISSLEYSDNINYDLISDYLDNIRKYNEKEQVKAYKEKMEKTSEYKAKMDLALKRVELRKRREEND